MAADIQKRVKEKQETLVKQRETLIAAREQLNLTFNQQREGYLTAINEIQVKLIGVEGAIANNVDLLE